jgi:uncharacterized protein YkwD
LFFDARISTLGFVLATLLVSSCETQQGPDQYTVPEENNSVLSQDRISTDDDSTVETIEPVSIVEPVSRGEPSTSPAFDGSGNSDAILRPVDDPVIGDQVSPTPTPTPTPKPTEKPENQTIQACIGGDDTTCFIESEIFRLTNIRRKSENRPALIFDAQYGYVARDWSIKQANQKKISHEGFPGGRTSIYEQAFGKLETSYVAGENVASVTNPNLTAQQVAAAIVNNWWNSPGHKKNILGDFSLLGIGISKVGNSFYATQLFGRR